MSIGSADVHTAVNTIWDASDLDDAFQALWSSGVGKYPVLHDGAAMPGQPRTSMPYCVMVIETTTTTDRMTGIESSLREVKDVPVRFNVHATTVDGDDRSAKQIANYFAEEITKVFGGHPTETPESLTLANGNHLWTQFVGDFGVETEENIYNWVINYMIKVDVPVMA